ncbi:MAG: hypothetical protein QGF09_18425, partial [Rhodospirillales bacterium]|nr:hypothetical protein [Rhodospirillales bacterium]
MSRKIFGDYDQAGLDKEYENRAKVFDSSEMLQRFAADSAIYRQQTNGRLGISFGPGADEALDIFLPDNQGMSPAPIQVFIHGGYWKMLSKDDFSYVAKAFTPK